MQQPAPRPLHAGLSIWLLAERAAIDLEGRQPPLELGQVAGAEAPIEGDSTTPPWLDE